MNYSNKDLTMVNKLRSFDTQILINQVLVFGEISLNVEENTSILSAIIESILTRKRFDNDLI